MPGSVRIRLRPASAALLAACAAAALLPETARAQNLFDTLVNALGGRPATAAAAPATARDANPNAWDFINRADRAPSSSAPRGGASSYCVRVCDGRYFPLPRRAANVSMSSAQICQAMCPSAETRVFNGPAIEHAVGNDGKSYKSMKTAFLYRDKTVNNCTCKPGFAGGIASMSVQDDPTLRRGDIVVTRDGPMVFTGEKRGETFVRPEDYRGLSMSTRKEIADIRVAKDPNETAMLPAGAAPASNVIQETAITYTPATLQVSVVTSTPVAEAFASFAK